jgi:hypothetical protein
VSPEGAYQQRSFPPRRVPCEVPAAIHGDGDRAMLELALNAGAQFAGDALAPYPSGLHCVVGRSLQLRTSSGRSRSRRGTPGAVVGPSQFAPTRRPASKRHAACLRPGMASAVVRSRQPVGKTPSGKFLEAWNRAMRRAAVETCPPAARRPGGIGTCGSGPTARTSSWQRRWCRRSN